MPNFRKIHVTVGCLQCLNGLCLSVLQDRQAKVFATTTPLLSKMLPVAMTASSPRKPVSLTLDHDFSQQSYVLNLILISQRSLV